MTISTDAIIFLGALAVIFGALGPGLWGWTLYRFTRFRAHLRNELGAEGYAVHTMDARWLTRGPFPDLGMPGTTRRRREYLLRVFAEDSAGKPHSGWVRWRAPLPWRSADQWALKWDQNATTTTQGMSSSFFYATVVLGGVIGLIGGVVFFLRMFRVG